MALTTDQTAALDALVTDWTETDDALATEWDTVPAASAPQVPIEIRETELLGLLSQGSLARLRKFERLDDVRNTIAAQDAPGVVTWANWLAAGDTDTPAIITTDEVAAITAYVAETRDDPAWVAPRSWAQTILGRDATAADAAEVRAAGGH